MKIKLSLLALLAASNIAFAQHKCASNEYLKHLDATTMPGIESQVKNLTTQLSGQKSRATITYIPVVVHIVYKNATENLTDDYVNAQIDQLNRCYGRTNSDTTSMRAVFKPIVGATKLRFILDKIIRVSTTVTSFDAGGIAPFTGSDAVKYTGSGGSDAVSPTTKLNVWVCDLKLDGSDGLIGYAYPPPGLPNWGGAGNGNPAVDGVVMDYLDFGGPLKQPKGYAGWGFRGKSLVHEIGHYFGLRHIWGDDAGACYGQSGYEDDGISDTPIQGDQTPDNCDTTINSCIQSPNDMPDMMENYMDYSAATCQNSFTKEQATFMENVSATKRTTVKVPTAISTIDYSTEIYVYPNPATNAIKIDINNVTFEKGSVSIYNMMGQLLKELTIESQQESISMPVEDLARGVYLIHISLDKQNLLTQKVILQ